MKVFFTASYKKKVELQTNYNLILQTLKKKKIDVIGLEVGTYSDLLPAKYLKTHSLEQTHYEYTLRGIKQAHAVIIEVSSGSFQLGHEATLGLTFNKPVLCLSNNTDHSLKIKHPLFKAAYYERIEEIPEIINRFLKKYENKFLTVRFNTFINPDQKNFLLNNKNLTGESASELIRRLIDAEMRK